MRSAKYPMFLDYTLNQDKYQINPYFAIELPCNFVIFVYNMSP